MLLRARGFEARPTQNARVVELVYTIVSKAIERKLMSVRSRLRALRYARVVYWFGHQSD